MKILYPKNSKLSTPILIYSIKQTLRPKKILDRSFDPKKYRGCKFATQKNTSDLPVMYTARTPLGRRLPFGQDPPQFAFPVRLTKGILGLASHPTTSR